MLVLEKEKRKKKKSPVNFHGLHTTLSRMSNGQVLTFGKMKLLSALFSLVKDVIIVRGKQKEQFDWDFFKGFHLKVLLLMSTVFKNE